MAFTLAAILSVLAVTADGKSDASSGQLVVYPFGKNNHLAFGRLVVYCILTVVFFLQAIHCILRISRADRRHRTPYIILLPSAALSVVFCVILIFLIFFSGIIPPDESPKGIVYTALYISAGLFDWLCNGSLFWSIVWFIRDRKMTLLAAQNVSQSESGIFCTAYHTILNSLVVGNTITGTIISAANAVNTTLVHTAEFNMVFYVAYVLWYIASSIEICISVHKLKNAMCDANVSDTFTRVLYHAVAPLYCANSFASIFFEVIYFPTFLPDLSQKAQNILSLPQAIFLNSLFLSIVAVLLIPQSCGDIVLQPNLSNAMDYSLYSATVSEEAIDNSRPLKKHHTKIELINKRVLRGRRFGNKGPALSTLLEKRHKELHVTERKSSGIATNLKDYNKWRRVDDKLHFLENRMTADSQAFSAISVVAIFVASLTAQLLSLAQTTFENIVSPVNSASIVPTTSENVNSCWYLTTFLSLIAGCVASVGVAMRISMACEIHSMDRTGLFDETVLKQKFEGPTDRALKMIFVFACITMGISVISLIVGLLVFVWATQTTYVSIAMTIPAVFFVIGPGILATIWIRKH